MFWRKGTFLKRFSNDKDYNLCIAQGWVMLTISSWLFKFGELLLSFTLSYGGFDFSVIQVSITSMFVHPLCVKTRLYQSSIWEFPNQCWNLRLFYKNISFFAKNQGIYQNGIELTCLKFEETYLHSTLKCFVCKNIDYWFYWICHERVQLSRKKQFDECT